MARPLTVLVFLLWASTITAGSVTPQTDLSSTADSALVGQWEGPNTWPLIAIHVMVMHTGKTLQFSYNLNSYVWDPVNNTQSPWGLSRKIFCAGNSFLPDGRVLVAGGTVDGTPEDVFYGTRDTHIFDPVTEAWTRVEDMAQGRWYPTNLSTADGRTYVFSGLDDTGIVTSNVEVYESGVGWQSVGDIIGLPLYPWLHLLSDGSVYYSGPTQTTARLGLDPLGVSDIILNQYGNRFGGVSVRVPPGQNRIMVLGGINDSVPTATAEIIDLNDSIPQWNLTTPMNHARDDGNAVILPDGTIFVVGGHSGQQFDGVPPESTAVFEPEMYDPQLQTWTVMAPMQVPRVYHSTAALLPDGRILCAGSDGYYLAEIFSPPYLFKGERPVIESAPSKLAYGSQCCIDFTSTTSANKVVLIRPAAQTHGTNSESKYILLNDVTCGPGPKQVSLPSDPNIATPGHYMLFVVNDDGVPSEAEWVQIVSDCAGGCDCEGANSCPGEVTSLLTGDVNDDGTITSADIIGSVNFVFKAGAAPEPCEAVGDVDCSGAFTSADIITQVNYVFKSGPAFCDVCAVIPATWSCQP